MRIVSWNMGCGPSTAKYRKTYREAWRYLLDDLNPDIALLQEALFSLENPATQIGSFYWSADHGSDSGAAVFTRMGLPAEPVTIRSTNSFIAGVKIMISEESFIIASIHVGPRDYKKNLTDVFIQLKPIITHQHFIVGGDLNAARHFDDVYGGQWYHRFFNELSKQGFHDCHWAAHGKEIQSFWGSQAREPYQDDHIFTAVSLAPKVVDCRIIDNPVLRELSDHAPVLLFLKDE